ncbi:hypothetical protein BU23DRAFT_78310 [Bimuria novae-zelandiae CBS 107.79]|uniref:Secreted protein n=1 Tax=Bimuria novae-zelandiae CBS 107.79 TaxID=1447943 RepID=A0A6A5UGL9_9PLEO|nr:hypothetical protein BU23DRAFT_78310 [Bimuria novae-zelandiae CBS 107.79]
MLPLSGLGPRWSLLRHVVSALLCCRLRNDCSSFSIDIISASSSTSGWTFTSVVRSSVVNLTMASPSNHCISFMRAIIRPGSVFRMSLSTWAYASNFLTVSTLYPVASNAV